MEIAEIIRELQVHIQNSSGLNRQLLATAINNLRIVDSKKLNGFVSRSDPRDFVDSPCLDCQPGRPCYGHGHY